MLLFLFGVCGVLLGQDFFRFKADFSLKEISTLNDSLERRLIIGSCYYDKNVDQLTYQLTFPEEQQWIIQDSFIYTLKDDVVVEKSAVPPITEHNIFRMLLEQTFSEFGMLKSGYEIQKVRKIDGDVYVTYKPPDKFDHVLGSLVLIKQKKKLKGVIYYEPDGNMMFRQQLRDYQIVDGLPVPTEMSHIIQKGDKEIKRILSFDNIVVNDTQHNDLYERTFAEGVESH